MKAIDLFAGMGGFSTGAKLAGVDVVWAANHWRAAVEIHAANHPGTVHACQDLQQADWREVPQHDIMLASPCCQGHSRARGREHGNPQHDASRSTAWAPVSAAEYHRPEAFVLENVPEFLHWTLFAAWRAAMEALGYSLTIMVLDAADSGVPQHRKRLFIIGVRAKNPIVLDIARHDHQPASSFVEFDAGVWSPLSEKVAATQARAARGRASFGERFLMPYYGGGSGLTGRCLSRPIGTITTRDRWGVVKGERMRMLSKNECRAAMGFPPDTILPLAHKEAVHMLGNAVAPIQAADVLVALQEAI
jgi:DNA (cytosine-5)-methyltransferase 1